MASEQPLLIDQPLGKAIRIVAIPAVGALLVRFTNHAVDQFWIGHLEGAADALAAIASASFLVWAIYSLAALFTAGLQALVARAVGAQDPLAKASAEKHGIALALLLGVLTCGLGLGLLDAVLDFQGITSEVKILARQYLAVILWGLPISYVGMAIETVYRAEGDTVTPFRLAVLALFLNVLLDPLLIRGAGPLPGLGVQGAALATVGVQLVQMVVLLVLHTRKERPARVRLELRQAWLYLRLGVPVAAGGTLFSFIYIAFVKVLAPFGMAPVAALGLCHTIEGLLHFVCVGFGMTAATLVGQNLGAERPAVAEAATWQVIGHLALMILPMSVGLWLFAAPLLGFFMNPPDPEVLRHGVQYLRVAAWVQLAGGVEIVMLNAMAGAGYTLAANLLDMGVWLLALPLSAWLAHRLGLGPLGVWLGIVAMPVGGAVAMGLLFRRGTWKRGQW